MEISVNDLVYDPITDSYIYIKPRKEREVQVTVGYMDCYTEEYTSDYWILSKDEYITLKEQIKNGYVYLYGIGGDPLSHKLSTELIKSIECNYTDSFKTWALI